MSSVHKFLIGLMWLFAALLVSDAARAERIREVASIAGVRNNQLVGYGVVVAAFVIVMEMVGGYGIVIDLMVVALLSSAVSRMLCPPLYRSLAQRMIRPGPQPV